MFYHIITTTRCNLQCEYCHGAAEEEFVSLEDLPYTVDYSVPEKLTYKIEKLKQFIEKDSSPTLTFYGGEPLCNMSKVKEIMDTIDARYMIQTNGILLHMLPSKYTNRFHTILVSLDGDKELTNKYRGPNVYEQVIKNIKHIKENGYKNELIARMTVMEQTDIEQAIKHLLSIGFTSIHWQLNAMFWENDLKTRNFEEWVKTSYNPGIKKLIRYWVDEMKKGTVLKLYPFLDITQDLILNRPSELRCGSGHSNYTVQTDGNILYCPIMIGMSDYYCGNITTSTPETLKKLACAEPCTSCDIREECGGRCLYSNLTKPWNDKGYEILKPTISNLIEGLKDALPEIKELIASKTISLEQFEHVKYNGCEIIP